MLQLRDAHTAGSTRVCVDGDHVLTGGEDGVVMLFPTRRWQNTSPLWARQCHDAAVTCVELVDDLHIAFSCGRDGNVVLHENIHAVGAEQTSTSRVACRVTGEVRCLLFDRPRHRVFIAGDSLRCLTMTAGTGRFEVRTIPLVVPHPIVALSIDPSGHLLAIASASGSIAVVGASPDGTTTDDNGGGVGGFRGVFSKVLPPSMQREDGCRCRMSWCSTSHGLVLVVPGAQEAHVFRLTMATPTAPATMRRVASIPAGELRDDLHGVSCYTLSRRRLLCVMAAAHGVVVVRLNSMSLAWERVGAFIFDRLCGSVGEEEEEATTKPRLCATDVAVNARSGDVVVGFSDGRLSLLAKAVPKAEAAAKKKHSETMPTATAPATEVETPSAAVTTTAPPRHRSSKKDEEGSDDDGSSYTSGSDGSSESSAPGSSDDDDDDVAENLERVVHDLKRSNAGYIDDDGVERPSRWREDDPSAALAEAERQRRSSFLDDEAEEASSGDAESEDEAAYADDGYGGRRSMQNSVDGAAEDDEEEEDDENERPAPATAGRRALIASDYSFQVCATPATEEDGGNCYLAYNSIGFIHCSRGGTTTVHFHDISHPAVRVAEKGQILMGTLSPVGAGFVVAPTIAEDLHDSVDAEEEPRLTILYRTFVAIGAQSDWRVKLLPGESVRSIACGIRFVAVATSRFLRLYSLSGLELAVMSKYAHVVTMVGTNSRKLMASYKGDFDPLIVVFLGDGCLELQVEVLDVSTRSAAIPAQHIALTPLPNGSSHQIQWVGWSEDGPLHVVDTAGVVRLFTQGWGGAWIPVFDPQTQAQQHNNLWVWGITDEALLAYRSASTTSPYPAAVATGLPVEHVSLALPLTRTPGMAERELHQWDQLVRRQIRTDEIKRHSTYYNAALATHDALHDRRLMELFQRALEEQQTTRALDLATMLELRDNVEACAKEANRGGHGQLVQKLLALYEMRTKAKQRRKCALPLEGTAVSEKERDQLLRRLLVKEKKAAEAPSDPASVVATANEPPPPVVSAPPPPPAPAARRHISFDLPPTPPPPPPTPAQSAQPAPPPTTSTPTLAVATTSTTAPRRTMVSSTTPTKPRNPFAARTDPPHTPAPTTPPRAKELPTPTPPTTPPRAKELPTPTPTPAPTVDGTPSRASSAAEEEVQILGASIGRSPAPAAIAGPKSPSPTKTPSAATTSAAPPSTACISTTPVDPFLVAEQEEADERLTVDAVLGAETPADEACGVASEAFGLALRKRLRGEEEDNDEDDVDAPHFPVVPLLHHNGPTPYRAP